MGVAETIALTLGLGWASGINLYATVFMLGMLERTGHLTLPPDLAVLSSTTVLLVAGAMYVVEFFADKIPAIDTGWDAIHTFIRIPAGAVLAAGVVGEVSVSAQLAAALAGGSLAAGTHTLKAGSRGIINVSPEPFSNWLASLSEDALVVGGLWAALYHPWLFAALLFAFVLLAIWLLPRIWRGLRRWTSHGVGVE